MSGEKPLRLGIFMDTWVNGGSRLFPRKLEAELTRSGVTVYLIFGNSYPWSDRKARQGFQAIKKALGERCFSLEWNIIKSGPWIRHRLRQFILKHGINALLINDYKDYLKEMEAISDIVPLISIVHSDHGDYYHAEYSLSEPYLSATVSPSQHIHAQLQMLTPPHRHNKLYRIPYGVQPTECFQQKSGGPMEVRVCSRLDFMHKRLQDLPAIWKKYLAGGGGGNLTIIGSGEALNFLQKEFTQEIASGKVSLPGEVAAHQVQPKMASGDVFLSTSNYEGLPQTVLEAACNGLYPLLSRINSGHQEIITQLGAGRSYAVGDTEGCARELIALEKELTVIRAERKKIREKALELYSMDQVVSSYQALLEKTCQNPPAAGRLPDYRPSLKEWIVSLFNRRLRRRKIQQAR